MNAASAAADESQDPLRSSKGQTKEAQVCNYKLYSWILYTGILFLRSLYVVSFSFLQEAGAFALYHKALDLQKHDKFEESAKAYHELLHTPLLKEVLCNNIGNTLYTT